MPKFISYQGIGFNQESAASKTFAEFSKHEKHHGLSDEQLKEIWDVAKGKKEMPAEGMEAGTETEGTATEKKKGTGK